MSIINEALKKTEAYLQKNSAKDNLMAPKPTEAKPFLLYILILLAGLLLGNFIFNLLSHKLQSNGLASNSTQVHGLPSFRQNQAESHKIQTTQTPKKNVLPIIQTTNSSPIAALPSQPPEENKATPQASFVLNGIFFSDNDGYALVNNQIVRTDDYVDGAKVGLITPNTVELNNAGETITLSTQR